MKKLLLILLACLPLFLAAREKKDNSNPKYLAGAVTLTEGKVSFSKEIKAPSLSKDAIYKQMLEWANERFQPKDKLQSRIVYTDEEKGEIAVSAEEYIVFSSSALSLDRTRIYYQLFIYTQNGLCKIDISRIRYWYDENRDGGERYTAEEWITDDMALNKKRTKLAPICGKFRRETIDLKDDLFNSAAATLGVQTLNTQTTIPAGVIQPATPTATLGSGELKDITFEQLPANLNTIVSSGRITLTANEEEIELKAENWGGFGKLFAKNVTYTLVDQSRIAINAVMEHSNTYKLSIYNSGNTQPVIVIECKKSMAQKMSAEDLKSLNQSADASKDYTMYIGEITRIQMR